MCLCPICIQFPQAPEEGVGSPGIGVTDGCEWPCGHWESNTDPLGEQLVLILAESSLQPSRGFDINIKYPPKALRMVPADCATRRGGAFRRWSLVAACSLGMHT